MHAPHRTVGCHKSAASFGVHFNSTPIRRFQFVSKRMPPRRRWMNHASLLRRYFFFSDRPFSRQSFFSHFSSFDQCQSQSFASASSVVNRRNNNNQNNKCQSGAASQSVRLAACIHRLPVCNDTPNVLIIIMGQNVRLFGLFICLGFSWMPFFVFVRFLFGRFHFHTLIFCDSCLTITNTDAGRHICEKTENKNGVWIARWISSHSKRQRRVKLILNFNETVVRLMVKLSNNELMDIWQFYFKSRTFFSRNSGLKDAIHKRHSVRNRTTWWRNVNVLWAILRYCLRPKFTKKEMYLMQMWRKEAVWDWGLR